MSTVLVLGGATGIGAAAVRAFRAQGDTVVLADRSVAAGEALVAEPAAGTGHFVEVDLVDPDAPRRAVEQAVAFAGGLDVVFYNAGILEAHPLDEWTVESWDRNLRVNLTAPFFTAQAAAPYLRQSEQGRIIITSSTGALRGHAGMPAYHSTKSGILGLVRVLADELGPDGITVNTVLPGWVDTPFNDAFWHHQDDPEAALRDLETRIPLGRQALPEDVVGTIVFLASPASQYITGQSIVVDGGYTAV